ncbi:amidase [Natronococcus wangiae]|uniref:amidase n=1 Tax=Natronococcus wangiae TaxID=3068275 RepID=UPI00273D8656|nr:amidase [Natronococcus sp. AD5]
MVDNNKQPSSQWSRTRRSYLKSVTGGSVTMLGFGSASAHASEEQIDSAEKDSEIIFTPTTVLAERIRTGELSPVRVVDAFLARIEERNDELNAFITLFPEQARADAREAERAIERGDDLGPLHGIPFAIKDRQKLEGVRFTDGFLAFKDQIAEETDSEVQAFLDAGAIPVGKTNTPEGGYMGKTDNLLIGPTPTPFDLDLNAGGSSGGSAAAVADGMLPFATGTDGAGSIRIPASFTGTYGLFPRIEDPGEFGTGNTYFQPSISTRTVADTALTLSVMYGDDEEATDYQAALTDDVEGVSIGYDPGLSTYPVDQRVRDVVDDSVDTITAEGATVEVTEVDLGQSYEEFIEAVWIVWTTSYAELAKTFAEEDGVDALGADRELFPETLVDIIETGCEYLDENGDIRDEPLAKTIEARSQAYAGLQVALREYDLIATPTLSVPPFPNDILGPTEVEGVDIHPIVGWLITTVCNMTGHPAASIPAGLTDKGTPVGLQLIGPSYDDRTIVAASAAYERVNPWHDDYPWQQRGNSLHVCDR